MYPKRVLSRIVITVLILSLVCLPWIDNVARAYQIPIFSEVLSVASSIGSITNTLNQTDTQVSSFLHTVIAPASALTGAQSFVSQSIARYRSYMNTVSGTTISSGSLSSTQLLERTFSIGGTSVSSPYYGSYGSPLSVSTRQSLSVRQQTDMSDAASIAAIDVSGRAMSSTKTTLQVAANLESSAAGSAPGTSDYLNAQATAAQLAAFASEHRMMAAELRLEAYQLAAKSLAAKRSIAAATNTQPVAGVQ